MPMTLPFGAFGNHVPFCLAPSLICCNGAIAVTRKAMPLSNAFLTSFQLTGGKNGFRFARVSTDNACQEEADNKNRKSDTIE